MRKLIRCSLRGKFKKEFNLKKDKLYHTDIAAVGDKVLFDLVDGSDSGIIHTIEKRNNYLSRKAPRIKGAGYRGERLEQIIASNVDLVCVVSSAAEPSFNNKVIDRFLVAAESSGLETIIIINKTDLKGYDDVKQWVGLYKSIGYKIFETSALSGTGIDELPLFLSNKKNLFIGQSGVGKSSLLNRIYPCLNLETGPISRQRDRGTHTTVTSIMMYVEENTYVIDTPGLREVDPYGIKKEDLGHYFIEFKNYIPACKFNTCTHLHEPVCGITDAVETGEISAERYESYLRMLETVEEDIIF